MKHMRRLLSDESGSPTMEFAAVAMLVALSLPAIIDTMTLLTANSKLSAATRAGTQYALKYPTDTVGIQTTVRTASGVQDMVVTSREFCECGTVETACGTACASGTKRERYSEITTTYDIADKYNYDLLYPTSLSSTITMRVQ